MTASIKIYGKEKNLSLHETGVAACFDYFLKHLLLPKAKGVYYKVESDRELDFLKMIYRVLYFPM